MKADNNNSNTKVHGFTLVEVIVALTILAIIMAMFAPSFTSYIDEAYKTKASAECSYVITATQSKIIELYAAGSLSQYLERNGFTITSNTIKKLKGDKLFDGIQQLAETEGDIKCIWIDESDMSVAGLAYLTADSQYYVIYSPKAEQSSYVYSSTDEYDDYKKMLKSLEDNRWRS